MNEEQKKQLDYIRECFEHHGIPIKTTELNRFEPLYPQIGIECGQYNEQIVFLELSQNPPKDRDHRLELIHKDLKSKLNGQNFLGLVVSYYNGNPDQTTLPFEKYLESIRYQDTQTEKNSLDQKL